MDVSDVVQIALVIVLTATLGAVLWYACETRKQAKASADMAKEMREQRLAEDEPWLILDITDQKFADYHEWDEHANMLRHKVTGEEIVPWPLPDCTIRLHNDGRRAAINIQVCYLEAANYSLHGACRSLIHGRTCTAEVLGFPAPYGGRPEWQEQLLQRLNVGRPGCIIARYEDVHGRSWVSYLDLDWEPSMTSHIMPLKQRRLRLDELA